ncbi:NAP1 [Symbiodinium necroappetens]|uniref:NAP1 protein n=1 Tax=Symbiodinium necroappetens TaxID=1628268 RepID=A0A812LUT7_9DINO|nr:NAP1 [Symbiodinium necroappetens]
MAELQKQYSAKQQPFIDQRTQILTNIAAAEGEEAKASGTPALRGFWKEAMKNLPALEEHIEEWDEPVLDYCKDITKAWLDEADISKGFKLIFHFVENPYFTNTELWKEYHVEEASPYTGEVSAKEIKAAEIDWNAGKNVTVEKVAKKVKGGGWSLSCSLVLNCCFLRAPSASVAKASPNTISDTCNFNRNIQRLGRRSQHPVPFSLIDGNLS